ncbi:putative ribonuclease H-like domain-containing protein [Tanacetum coccineum]|uniref:Ribonuclease H-like domain-containing protein n=1 Tax=Tanacetum coccineum TaxID=301880 RepID=A0ABQ4X9I5_9ASTR
MQEEFLQFKLQKVWVLVDLPYGKKVTGTKLVFRNKRDEKSIVVKNKARLVAQGFRQEEGIDYDEVFAPVARIEAIRLFLAFASYMGFTVYQMDVKSAFLYGTIEEEVRGTIDKTLFIKKKKSDIMLVQVYVDDIIFGSTKKSMCTEFEECMHKRFQMSSMGELTFFLGLQVKQQSDGIFISQDKSMIDSLMYLTASRPDIMFAVCACARFQVTLKASHLNAVKRIFSDYGGASLDRKSTTGGCQFLGRRLISWQCKKKTIVANSTTEAEYVAVANCYGQVLWIHNQIMDYGFNFINTKIHIDNESTISVIKNPIAHSRTKHIEIRFHFIRDCYKKRLIEVIKIHTDHNVADLLTKGFDVTRFNFLVYSDKHNMVVFLKKPNESVGFTEVVDFLKGTSLRYALTHNPTIYDSLVKQFWQTVTVRTLANGTPQLVASIDSKEYTITEAYVRSKLQLADATGIHNLSDAEIYAGLATLGCSYRIRSYEAPLPEGNTSGSVEASIQLKELMKVKSLEKALKRKSKKVIVSASEGEEPEDQGRIIQDIDDDPLVSLVRESMKEKSTDFVTPTKALGEAQEEEISPTTGAAS